MRTFAAIVIIAVLVLLGWWIWNGSGYSTPSGNPTSTSTATSTGSGSGSTASSMETYTDPQGAFSFQYPSAFAVTGRQSATSSQEGVGWSAYSQRPGIVLAKVYIDRSYMPQTNFSEAWFQVGWSSDSQAINDCTKNISNVSTSTESINGTSFKRFSSTDVGAGNYYETVAYRAVLDGDCYSIEHTIHYGNFQNYDPSMGIKEFDKAKVESLLESMAQSFKFTGQSD